MRNLWALSLILLLAACRSGHETPLTVTELYAGSHCGHEADEPTVRYFRDARQMPAAMAEHAERAEAFVLIEMGARPTGGYALQLADPTASVTDGVARLRVRWQEPAPEAMVTQAFTSPCLLLGLPAADYRRIEVLDQSGAVRAQANLH